MPPSPLRTPHGALTIDAARGPAVIDRLLEQPLRALVLETDLSGNDDEIAEVLAALRPRLPASLRHLRIDRRRHWDHHAFSDEITVHDDGQRLAVELGQAEGPRPLLPIVAAMLGRDPGPSQLAFSLWARGPVDVDDVIEMLVTCGPRPSVHEVSFDFCDGSALDWMRWLRSRRLTELLPLYPDLRVLSVPIAELWIPRDAPFAHPNLRQLELHWFGTTPLGPKDPWGHGRPLRAAGLTFLRAAELPALERLAVDLQRSWYVPWEEDDIAALCEAELPRLTTLVLRYCDQPIATHLPAARFAAQLEHLDLTGVDMTDDALRTLIDARPRFSRLRTLRSLQPLDASDDAWAAFMAAYPVVIPD